MRALLRDDRLEAIAGAPAGFQIGVGSVSAGAFTEFGGRTLYAVFEVIGSGSGWQLIAFLGSAAGIRIQTDGGVATRFNARFDTINGQANLTRTQAGAVAGRHVVWAMVNDTMTEVALGGDQVAPGQSGAMASGDGMSTTPTLQVANVAGWVNGIAAVAYRAAHDPATRRLVMSWLARRFGAPPPPLDSAHAGGSRRLRRRDLVLAS